jgi:hypothetical protein
MVVRLPVLLGQWVARLLLALVVAGSGAAVCLANDHYWQSKITPIPIVGGGYPPIRAPAFDSIGGDLLLVAIPFYVLAALVVVFNTRILAAVIALAALVYLTVLEYRWNATSDSSTAPIVFLWSWFGGIPIVAVVAALDAIARARWRAARSG